MNFERKVIETLKDDNGNEIKKGDYVVYRTKSKPNVSIIAEYYGMDKGYMVFVGLGVKGDEKEVGYTIQPKTIGEIFKCKDIENLF